MLSFQEEREALLLVSWSNFVGFCLVFWINPQF